VCASLIFRQRTRKSATANFIDREPGIKESQIVAVRGRSSKDTSRSPGKHRCWPGARRCGVGLQESEMDEAR